MKSQQNQNNNSTAILWTGGKDCALAAVRHLQNSGQINKFITFGPANPNFKAHPIEAIKEKFNLFKKRYESLKHAQYCFITIEEPYEENYKIAFQKLQKEGITKIITGDIALIDNVENFITQIATPIGIEVLTPIWAENRSKLLDEMLNENLEFVVTYSEKKNLQKFVNVKITKQNIEEFKTVLAENNFDLCGENGEYHTMIY